MHESSNIKPFIFSTAKQSDSVVVIGGGVSAKKNAHLIQEYIKTNQSLVFTANYDYEKFNVYYVYFTDKEKFDQNIQNIKCPNIIFAIHLLDTIRRYIKKNGNKFNFYYCGSPPPCPTGPYKSTVLTMLPDGTFPYMAIGTAGFACIALAVLCRPKKILITGFDGQTPDQRFRININNKLVPFKNNVKKTFQKQKYLHNVLFPFVLERGIILESFSNDSLWQADKEKIGIVNIQVK